MNVNQPRLIQTYLPNGTLEGPRIIELSESSIKAFVIPRLQLNKVKDRPELQQPALYVLIDSDNSVGYIGESESFFHRVKNHDQRKEFWDTVVVIISNTNSLEKSDVRYLESLAVERAQAGSMEIINKTVPAKNNIHEFKLHILQRILDDTQLILTSLGFDLLSKPEKQQSDIWHCTAKKTVANAQYRGDKFVVLKGSIIDKSYAPKWDIDRPSQVAERSQLLQNNGRDLGDTVELTKDVAFKSPNHAGKFAAGRSVNAWILWKNDDGVTMDEVMRRSDTIIE